MSYIHIVLNIIPTLYEGYIVSVHRMVMENRPVDPGSIQGSHRPLSFIRIKHRTRADDILCKTNHHIVGLDHKNHIIRTCMMYHAAWTLLSFNHSNGCTHSWRFSTEKKKKSWKTSAVSTTDGMAEVASCMVHQTRSLDVLILYFIYNMFFVN